MANYLKVSKQPFSVSVALVAIRGVVGLAFMFHGWSKIQHPFGWMGPESDIPSVLLALAAVSEFGGGFAWILGMLTPLASLGILCTMGFAVSRHILINHDSFVGHGSSYELALVFLCVALLLFSAGPGRFSVDRVLFGERK